MAAIFDRLASRAARTGGTPVSRPAQKPSSRRPVIRCGATTRKANMRKAIVILLSVLAGVFGSVVRPGRREDRRRREEAGDRRVV